MSHRGYEYREEFLWRFLHNFSRTLHSFEDLLGRLHEYFNPFTTTAEMVRYLAQWVALEVDENWPEDKLRQLVAEAVQLYKLRGRPEGIARWVEIYTGYPVRVIEHYRDGLKVGVRSTVGVDTKIYEGGRRGDAMTFTVRLTAPTPSAFDMEQVERIIELQKPSWAKHYIVAPDGQFMQIGVRSTIGFDTILGE